MGIERRKYRRVPIVTEVECAQRGTNFLLPTRDISVGGVFLHTKESFPPDTVFHLRFYVEGKTLIEADAHVTYTVPGLGVGVEFTDLPKSQREILEAFITAQPETGPEAGTEPASAL